MLKSVQIKNIYQKTSDLVKKLFKNKLRYILPISLLTLLSYFLKTKLFGYGFLALVMMLAVAVIFVLYLLSFTNATWSNVIKKVIYCAIALAVIAVTVAEVPIISTAQKKETADSDYCIVLGCAVYGTIPSRVLSSRLNSAYEYLSANPDSKAILSGGKGDGESISEAQCMYNVLTSRGIDPSRLIKEDRSTSTKENLKYSKELIEKECPDNNAVTIISSETHLYRACLLAKEAGFDPKPYRAHTNGLIVISQYLRESVAVWYEWLF